MSGTWHDREAGARGALVGTRAGPAPRLTTRTALACEVCCDVAFHCEDAGPGTCNASNTCREACAESGTGPAACLAAPRK